jgi:hypothetical protein
VLIGCGPHVAHFVGENPLPGILIFVAPVGLLPRQFGQQRRHSLRATGRLEIVPSDLAATGRFPRALRERAEGSQAPRDGGRETLVAAQVDREQLTIRPLRF